MPERTLAEIDSDNIESVFYLILNASSAMDYPNSNEFLTVIKKRLQSDLLRKEINKAATDFTLHEAIETFGLKNVESPEEYFRNHEWDIEKM